MEIPKGFELMLVDLKSACVRASTFAYLLPDKPFREAVTQEFQCTKMSYGVYVIRRRIDRQVIYIGKGGTIKNSGKFGAQDVPGRLKAERSPGVTSEMWSGQLCREYGALTIEYFILNESLSPGFVESMLLQAFRNDFGKLPDKNKSL